MRQVRLLVSRTVADDRHGAVGERERTREDLDRGPTARDLHHLAAAAGFLAVLIAVHVLVFAGLLGVFASGGIVFFSLVLVSCSGGALRTADRQVIHHSQHL